MVYDKLALSRATKLALLLCELSWESKLQFLNLPLLYYDAAVATVITVYQVLHRRVDVDVLVFLCRDYIPYPWASVKTLQIRGRLHKPTECVSVRVMHN